MECQCPGLVKLPIHGECDCRTPRILGRDPGGIFQDLRRQDDAPLFGSGSCTDIHPDISDIHTPIQCMYGIDVNRRITKFWGGTTRIADLSCNTHSTNTIVWRSLAASGPSPAAGTFACLERCHPLGVNLVLYHSFGRTHVRSRSPPRPQGLRPRSPL